MSEVTDVGKHKVLLMTTGLKISTKAKAVSIISLYGNVKLDSNSSSVRVRQPRKCFKGDQFDQKFVRESQKRKHAARTGRILGRYRKSKLGTLQ
jgi:hypothetical protein